MQKILLHEVGMRDGLQMESAAVPTDTKVRWLEALAASGLDALQVGSFVHPGKVPQMADTDRLFPALAGRVPEGVALSALVLNEKGLERGFAAGVRMFCMGVSASETHSMKNTGMPIEEATGRIIAMARTAGGAGAKVQVSVQSAFGCGYEGDVPPARVLDIVRRYVDAGLRNISLADTAGHATPDRVSRLYESIQAIDGGLELACHFHNTYGMAIVNCYAAMQAGVQSFESSVAGLGGCPFTKIAGGNVSTEDLVHMLHHMGLRKDVSLEKLIVVAREVETFFARELPGTIYRTGPIHARAEAV